MVPEATAPRGRMEMKQETRTIRCSEVACGGTGKYKGLLVDGRLATGCPHCGIKGKVVEETENA